MGSRVEGRAKEKENIFFVLKVYMDELDSKAIRQSFPGNGARNACWYFLTLIEKSANARKYRCSTSPRSIQGIVFFIGNRGVPVF